MKIRLILSVAVILLISLVLALPVCANIIYVSTDGNDSNDGSSWEFAKQTVQAGLNASSGETNDEVWVAKGTYVGCITLTSGVKLYGGFTGNETNLTERPAFPRPNSDPNETVLDGNKSYFIVISPEDAIENTKIDGFTIRNGSNGGLYCNYSSPTISNNTISGNTYWGGIRCNHSSPIITNNTIKRNSGNDGGISCYYSSSPRISNNTISGNSNCGIYSDYTSLPTILNNIISANGTVGIACRSSATISNNTIVGNGGNGISCGSSSTVVNNIISFNGYIGISGYGAYLRNNCVYNPDGYANYDGLNAGTGDISVDPMLADLPYGNVHIRSDSPCVNAGDDSVVPPTWIDMDSQMRIQGAHVDIGADESDGTQWPTGPNVIVRVSLDGNDANDGSSWALAKQTVQAGIDAASAQGGDVWVTSGTYNKRITLLPYAYLYGGFAGTEGVREERDWAANTTVLDGNAEGSVVTATTGHSMCAIDGFTITNGSSTNGGGGICCSGSSPTISNNTITGNYAYYGGGIYFNLYSGTISNNIISGNSAGKGGGIYSYSSLWPTISNNIITNNAAGEGGGIYCEFASPTISNNTIAGNDTGQAGKGGGIYCLYYSSKPQISNNIVAFNSSGMYNSGGAPKLRNNDIYRNGYNYSGLSAGSGDISADPLFVDRLGGDYHLRWNSPCINRGWNDAPGLPETDIDGQGRIFRGTVDIGADEYWPILVQPKPIPNPTPIILNQK